MTTERHRLSTAAFFCFVLTTADRVAAEDNVVSRIIWQELSDAGSLKSGEVVADEASGSQVLMIADDSGALRMFPLVEITDPQITARCYAIRGRVRYEDVGGAGFLEMWSYFADGSQYFSRTLETGGALQMLSGDSPWRDFALPFDLGPNPNQAKPNRLVVNLVLPESGTVWISNLELVELPETSSASVDGRQEGQAAERSAPVRHLPAHIVWQKLSEAGSLQSGAVIADATSGSRVLKVSNDSGAFKVFPLAEIDNPEIGTRYYAIRGKVRYEGVGGNGFLEMWSYLPNGSFFSRTLDTGGPLQVLSGDSSWRDFALPADLGPDLNQAKPNRLVMNLVLPESGTVWISDLELVELDGISNADLVPGAWWGGRTSGVIGGGTGGLIGILLGLAGLLIGIGRGRGVVTTILITTAGLGVVFLIGGLIALGSGQPFAVTYPLLLVGALALFFGVGGLPMSRVLYRQREFRQMQALDA